MSFGKLFGLNNEQMEAVDIEKNIALSAGAGSGKTRVLTSRFLTLIEKGIHMDQIVAITFTEKAALEMKERIREGIITKIEKESEQNRIFWQEQLDKLLMANISTIHSFCSNIIKENAALIGIDFDFEIISPIEQINFLNDCGRKMIDNLINSEKYEEVKYYILHNYDEKYFNQDLLKDVLKCRENILESAYTIEEMHKKYKGSLIEEFIMKVIVDIEKEYEEYKLSRDILDFCDLQIKTVQVLENKDICKYYREKYSRFLVDEFQDINEIQKKLIYKFTAKNNIIEPKRLFIVGDLKQSIYGFRGADCKVFKKVSQEMSVEARKQLSICYRSEKEIIYGINEIFSKLIENYEPLNSKDEENGKKHILNKRITMISYNKEEQSSNTPTLKEVKDIIKKADTENEQCREVLNNFKNTLKEVNVKSSKDNEGLLKSIKVLLNKGLEFKDICILMRDRSSLLAMENELQKFKIPYCVIGGIGFYNQREVRDILNLYELVTNGFEENLSDDVMVKLVAALRSPLFHISDDLIIKIRKYSIENNMNFIKAAENMINENAFTDDDKHRISETVIKLKELEKNAQSLSTGELIKNIIEKCNIYEVYLSQNHGIKLVRNIEKLVNIAEEYDYKKFGTHDSFIDYIRDEIQYNINEGDAALDNEHSNAIKIMTIHASKGLEFEGVIIPNVHKNILSKSHSELRKINVIYGYGEILIRKNLTGYNNKNFTEYVDGKLIDAINEEIRVLYVAMTRAKKHIVLVGCELIEEINNPQNEINTKLNSYSKIISFSLNKGKGKRAVELLHIDELQCMDIQVENINEDEFNENILNSNLQSEYKCTPKFFASASMYMKLNGCPRRYYYDNIMKIPYDIFSGVVHENNKNVLFDEENAYEEEKKEVRMPLYASARGSIAHSVIEYIDKNGEAEVGEYINNKINEYYTEDSEDEEIIKKEKKEVKEIILRYLENYKNLRDEDEKIYSQYELIYEENEAFYMLSPLEDKRMIIPGFIDKLKIYIKEGIYKAVIIDYKTNKICSEKDIEHFKEHYYDQLMIYGKAVKDLMCRNGKHVDEIELKLYFLGSCSIAEMKYDEEKSNELISNMNSKFSRLKDLNNIEDFACIKGEECIRCNYKLTCM